jgi:hypothetical protein
MNWDPDFYLTAISEILREKGMMDAYGWPRAEAGIHWSRPASGDLPAAHLTGSLLWMSRNELRADTAKVARANLRPAPTNAATRTPPVSAAE